MSPFSHQVKGSSFRLGKVVSAITSRLIDGGAPTQSRVQGRPVIVVRVAHDAASPVTTRSTDRVPRHGLACPWTAGDVRVAHDIASGNPRSPCSLAGPWAAGDAVRDAQDRLLGEHPPSMLHGRPVMSELHRFSSPASSRPRRSLAGPRRRLVLFFEPHNIEPGLDAALAGPRRLVMLFEPHMMPEASAHKANPHGCCEILPPPHSF